MKQGIDIDIIHDGHVWANVKHDSISTLIGMYEDGEVARQLFNIDNDRLPQLIQVLQMLINKE